MNSIRFKVGGLPLEISAKLLERFPNSGLYHFSKQQPNDPPFLLDHNPFAFLVILDFLRTDVVYIPRNVNTALVKRLFAHYGLPTEHIVELDTESSLPGGSTFSSVTNNTTSMMQSSSIMAGSTLTSSGFDLPPAYQPSPTVGPSSDKKQDPVSRAKEYYTTSLDAQQKIVYKKLEPMIFSYLLPILSSHVDEGHERLRVYFTPTGVQKETIANDTHAEDLGFPKEFFSPMQHGIDVTFLAQPKVMDLFKKIIVYSTGVKDVSYEIRSMTTRIENAFGLYESQSCDIPILTIRFPPNCAF